MAQTQLTKQASKEFIVDFYMNLIASGFTSAWMRELFPEDTENKFDRIFVMFERLGFSGKEAAVAIKEASTAFHRNKVDAEKKTVGPSSTRRRSPRIFQDRKPILLNSWRER